MTRSALAVFVGLAWAAEAGATTLTVSPTVQDLTIVPGETATYTLQVGVPDDLALAVRIYPWDYWWEPGTGRFTAPPGTTPRSAVGWIDVVPSTVSVGADKPLQEVLVSVSAPPDAKGAYYAVLFAQTEYSDMTGVDAAPTAVARVGSVLVLHMAGTLEYALKVHGASFAPPTAATPAQVVLEVQNHGNTDVMPSFTGLVRTIDGDTVGRLDAQLGHRLLPGETGKLEMRWAAEMGPGAYELVGTVLYGEDKAIPLVQPLLVSNPASSPLR